MTMQRHLMLGFVALAMSLLHLVSTEAGAQTPTLFAITSDGQLYELDTSGGTATSVRSQLGFAYQSTQSLVAANGKFHASYDNSKIVRFGFTASDEEDLGSSGVYNVEGLGKHLNGTIYAVLSADNDANLRSESLGIMDASGDIEVVASPFNVNPEPGDADTRDLNSIEVDTFGRIFVGHYPSVQRITFVYGGDLAFTSPALTYPGNPPSSVIDHPAIAQNQSTELSTARMYAVDTSIGAARNIISYEQGTPGFSSFMTASLGSDYVTGMTWAYKCSDVDDNVFIQNHTIAAGAVHAAEDEIAAGNNVDGGQAAGDVTIASTASVVFKGGNRVRLEAGFEVQAGAQFGAYVESNFCI